MEAPDGLDEVTVYDPAGVPILSRRFPSARGASAPLDATLALPLGVDVGRVGLRAGEHSWSLPPPEGLGDPLQVVIGDAGAPRLARSGDTLTGDDPAGMDLELRAARAGRATVGDAPVELVAGERRTVRVPIVDGRLVLGWDGEPVDLRWAPASPGPGLGALEVVDRVFPASSTGARKLDRPPDRIDLASPAGAALRRLLFGRDGPRDPDAPWAHEGVLLRNTGDAPLDLVLEARILGPDGAPHPAFAPRARGGQARQDRVRALVRVPAGGEALAVLPVYIDEAALSGALERGPVRLDRELRVAALGDPRPPRAAVAPLGLRRSSPWIGLGLVGAGAAGLGGLALLGSRGRVWLRQLPTSALMGIALFSALGFGISALGTLVTMALAAALGPFAFFVTGLAEDVLRTTLLAALLTLLPRPGVAGLSAAVQWMLLAAAHGGGGPVELWTGAGRIFSLELALWVAGVTRGGGRWRDQGPVGRWARLGGALAAVGLWGTLTGFAVQSAVYRMHYAGWYVGLAALLPGFVYPLIACGLAVPVADGLRRVQR